MNSRVYSVIVIQSNNIIIIRNLCIASLTLQWSMLSLSVHCIHFTQVSNLKKNSLTCISFSSLLNLCVHILVSSRKVPEENPSKIFLELVSLPNDDKAKLELKQVAAVTLAHLDRIAEPYLQLEEVLQIIIVIHSYSY